MFGSVMGVFFRDGRGILSILRWDFDRTEPKPQSIRELAKRKVFCQRE